MLGSSGAVSAHAFDELQGCGMVEWCEIRPRASLRTE